jgi:hypothetical protein
MRHHDDEHAPARSRTGRLPLRRAGRHAAAPGGPGAGAAPQVPVRRADRRRAAVPVWRRGRTLAVAMAIVAAMAIGATAGVRLFGESPSAGTAVRAPEAVPAGPGSGPAVPAGSGPGALGPAVSPPVPLVSPTATPSTRSPSAARATPSRTPKRSPATSATPVRLSLEAERAGNVIGGRAGAGPLDGASGGRIVGTLGLGDANFLRFTGVTVPDAGTYALRIHYISGEPRRAVMSVNGRAATTVAFGSTGSWRTVGTTDVRVTLRSGANTIQFGHGTEPCPDFDRVDVTR